RREEGSFCSIQITAHFSDQSGVKKCAESAVRYGTKAQRIVQRGAQGTVIDPQCDFRATLTALSSSSVVMVAMWIAEPLLVALLLSCIASVHPQSIPAYSSCSDGESPIFLLQHNATTGDVIKRVSAASLIECADRCAANEACLGVVYLGNRCKLLSSIGEGDEPEEPLLSKICVKSARICSSPFQFDVHEQKILVGFAREVVSADSLSVCLAACLNSFDTFGFECESVMYYPIDSECILNTEDRLDRPDLFVDELDDHVIYLDNNCAGCMLITPNILDKTQCYAPYVTQYIAVEGRQLANELDHQFIADLESCESLCTQRLSTSANDFNCKSFMHNAKTNTCILSDERSKPLGRAALVDADGYIYYEKKCFASPRTCRNVPSFRRVPQMILVGFAAFVMENVPSVTMCLDQCTNPPPETGENFVCKSVMYYYNEQECILNAETRQTKPDLFIPEGEEFQVDYFDIMCHLEKEACPKGTTLRSIRTLNAALPEGDGSLHILQSTGNSVGECLAKCYELAPEKCRSFNFDKQTSECDLLYVDGKTTLRPSVRAGVDLYDLHCLADSKDCSPNKDGAVYSRYLCEGVNYNRRSGQCDLFEQIEGNGEQNDLIDFYKNVCLLKEVDSGVSSALNVPQQAQQRLTGGNKTMTHTSSHKVDTKTEILSNKKVKPILREQEPQRRAPEGHGEKIEAAPTVEVREESRSKSFASRTGASLTVSELGQPVAKPVVISSEAVRTICNYEGIKVQVKNNEAFSGVMFVKNKYDTCRVEVSNSDSATLLLGLPADFGMKIYTQEPESRASAGSLKEESEEKIEKIESELRARRQADDASRDCGLQDMLNGTYKTTVVVQTNNLGIPGLVTSMDQIYEVSCDYSSMLGGKVTAGANMTINGPEASLIQPRGKIELGNPVLMQMLSGQGVHQPVLQAKLGDILELRWEIMAMDEELDFFVRDCFAEPGGNAAHSEEKLQLIADGCPTAAVSQKLIPGPIEVQSSSVKIAHLQAFRFDSSSTVRITCHLDICKGSCEEAICLLGGEKKQSWGRKKRSDNSVTEYETKRYKVPRHAQATTSLVVIDPLQQIGEATALARSQTFDFTREDPSLSTISPPGQLCMAKVTLLSVFGLLFALTAIQAAVVAQYVFRRLFSTPKSAY
uniref:ZP domain-containing protein n=1 Tax=Ascaris lumbricoides TaxID=6252 RepID=A0A9J2P8T1_ASCLU